MLSQVFVCPRGVCIRGVCLEQGPPIAGSASRGDLHPVGGGVCLQGVGQTPLGPHLGGLPNPNPQTRTAGGTHPTGKLSCYCPQRSWGKVMFLQASVMLLTGRSASVHAGIADPPGSDTPPGSRHP